MTATLNLYLKSEFTKTKAKMAEMSEADLKLIDSIYALAEANYSNGGSWIVEAHTPWEVLEKFKTLDDAREYMGLIKDREEDILNA